MGVQRQRDIKQLLLTIGFGQVIMLLNVSSSVFTKYLQRSNASVPTFQNIFIYVSLAIVYLTFKAMKQTPFIGVKWWFYILLALVDVEANYFCVKSFNYGNFATLGLLLNMTVPFATLFCYVFLQTRYSYKNYLGCVIAFSGCIVVFTSDFNKSNNGSHELKGDILSVIAAALYATSNVMFQSLVKTRTVESNVEALGYVGLYGSLFSSIQVAIWEWSDVEAIQWRGALYGYLIGYVVVMFIFYTMAMVLLKFTESVMFNLSLFTAPIFTVMASYLFFDEPVNKYYWLALVCVYIGLYVYSLESPEEKEDRKPQIDSNNDISANYNASGSPISLQDESAKPIVQHDVV